MYKQNIFYIFGAYFKYSRFIAMAKTEKRQRFEKVAGNRVQKILDTLTLLQNCSNRNNYEYSESDVEQMFSEISKALNPTLTL